MSHHAGCSLDKQWHLPAEISPNQSSCSSDTGDVLIRSTRVLPSDRRQEAEPGAGSVKITVQKLRDPQPPVSEQQQQSSGTERQQRPKPRQKPDIAPPLQAVVDSQPYRQMLKKTELTKEKRPPAAELSPDRKLYAGTHSQQQPGGDLLTSHFTAGGRGVGLAALKKRCHSATHRREVKVQLLDPGPLQTRSKDAPSLRTSSQDAPGLGTSSQDAPGLRTSLQDSVGVVGIQTEAAAAGLIQAQVDARLSQLADGVHKLLQADRDKVWSLSQQTLHHIETHSHQLQLQSQLLESTLSIVMSRAPDNPTASDPAVTPDLRRPGDPACLQVTHLDTAAKAPRSQQPSSSASTREAGPFTMATPHSEPWPEENRDDQYRRDAPSVSTATQPAAGSHLRTSANDSQTAASRANDMLREMERLKTPEDSLKTTRAGPDHHQSQQKLHQSQQTCSHQIQSQQNLPQRNHLQFKSQQTEAQHFIFQQNDPQAQQVQSQQTSSQSHQSPLQQIQSQENPTRQTHSQKSRSIQIQKRPPAPSVLEEARRVLRQVQRQKKVLDENLEALQRASTGEILHCQLDALAANRDWPDKVQIKRTVDAWINVLTKDIQAEMSSENAAAKPSASRDATVTSQEKVAGRSAPKRKDRPVSVLRGTGSKTVAGRGSKGQTAGQKLMQVAEPDTPTGRGAGSEQVEVDGESYLSRLYGRAAYEGMRRTMKKSPYLHVSSPGSPLSRKPRPRLVGSVRGVKVESCKMQTCLAPPLNLPPGPPQRHYIISSSHLTSGDPAGLAAAPADSHSIPTAIPLGPPRRDSSSRCLIESQQVVTSPATAPPTSSEVAVDNGASELQLHLDAGEAPPPPPGPQVDIIERKSEEEEDEDNIFPGTDFLSVADVNQEEVSAVTEEAVELDGGPSPPRVVYQGPAFPPQARSALPAQGQASTLDINLQRHALENRMVEWVEQQVMSRVISEMYRPPLADPTQNQVVDQSESEGQSVTSDIVEAAGGGDLQLFIDSNMVDSALVTQLVEEVLREQIARILGHRDTDILETRPEPGREPPQPGPRPHQEEELEPLVPTPVPTPPPSQTPSSRETPPLTTPPPSEPSSLLNEEPITAPEHIETPAASPEPAHSAGSPPASPQAPPSATLGDSELPLEEERPEEHLVTHTQPLSVPEEVPPPPPPPIPPAHPQSPPPPPPTALEAGPPSPSRFSEDSRNTSGSSSSSSSSLVTAETDAELKHVSEGELLISANQQSALTEEDTAFSFSSSGQELQEDFDPPEEVIGHDILRTLVNKMKSRENERGERPQPEGSQGRDQAEEDEEVSQGELRDDWTTKPHWTTYPNSKSTAAAWQGQSSSSTEQMSQCADVSEVSLENQGSGTVGDLMGEPIGALTFDLRTNLSLSPPPLPHMEDRHAARQVVPVQVRQYEPQTAGTRRMDVHLPSVRPEEEVMEEVMLESPADTDSSISDVF